MFTSVDRTQTPVQHAKVSILCLLVQHDGDIELWYLLYYQFINFLRSSEHGINEINYMITEWLTFHDNPKTIG